MNQEPGFARPCRCERPVLNDETCLRCGRSVSLPATALAAPPRRRPPRERAWTPASIARALQAFAFFRGRPPASTDWTRRAGEDWPPLEAVEDLFGSLEAAVIAAGLGRPRSRAVGA